MATEWQLRFEDHFNDGTPPVDGWPTSPSSDWEINRSGARNGAITEPAGTDLVLSWAATVDTAWKTGGVGTPYAKSPCGIYVLQNDNHSWISGLSRTFRAELKITGFTGGNYQEGGMVIYDPSLDVLAGGYYGFLFGWNNNNSQLTIRQDQYILGVQTHSQIANTGAFAFPGGGLYLRYYFNPYHSGGYENQPTTLDDVDGYVLQPGWAAFYYKTTGSWTRLLAHDTRALAFGFNPWLVGPWAGNRDSTTPVGSWSFDYLNLYQEPNYEFGPVSSDSGGTLRIETASAEEAIKFEVPGYTSLSTGTGTPVSELKPTGAAEEAVRVIPPSFVGHSPTNRAPLTQLVLQAAPSAVVTVAPEFPASAEESIRIVAGQTPTFHQGNSDSEGHVYFIGTRVLHQTYYDATKDVWHAPTPNFNGYGRNGYLYVSGVQQVTQAPWRTEAASVDRSSRPDFPLRSMICTTQLEVVIFDLDSWPTSIKVWMRFRLGADSSNYYMIGRGTGGNTVRKAVMKNGLLAVGLLNTPWEVGGIVLIDFKTVGQYAANLIRSDNHWRLISGKTIANRNTNGLWETFSSGVRLSSNMVQWVDIFQLWAYWNDLISYIVTGGEDGIEIIYYTSRTSTAQVDGAGAGVYRGTLFAGADQSLYTPAVVFDEDGWLWWSSGNRVYRSVIDHLWASNFIQGYIAAFNYAPGASPYIELNHVYQNVSYPSVGTGDQVVCQVLQPVGRYIFVGTNVGVFRVDRVTMVWTFCYSIVGFFGGGRLNVPPAGEVIAGDQPFVGRMNAFRTTESDYLVVSTVQGMTSAMPYHAARGKGAVTIIRLYDDYAIQHVNPALYEDGAWSVNGVLY